MKPKELLLQKNFNENKYSKTLKKEGSKFLKTSAKKALQKAAPAVGDYIGSKINLLHYQVDDENWVMKKNKKLSFHPKEENKS